MLTCSARGRVTAHANTKRHGWQLYASRSHGCSMQPLMYLHLAPAIGRNTSRHSPRRTLIGRDADASKHSGPVFFSASALPRPLHSPSTNRMAATSRSTPVCSLESLLALALWVWFGWSFLACTCRTGSRFGARSPRTKERSEIQEALLLPCQVGRGNPQTFMQAIVWPLCVAARPRNLPLSWWTSFLQNFPPQMEWKKPCTQQGKKEQAASSTTY